MDSLTPPPRIDDDIANESGERLFGGWAILTALFALLLFSAVSGSFRRSTEKSYAQQEAVLGQAVRVRRLSTIAGIKSNAAAETLDTSIAAVRKDIATSVFAARWVAVAEGEQGVDLDATSKAALEASHKPEDLALLSIYGSKTLSKQEAQQAAESLPEAPFHNALAKVHANERAGIEPSGRDNLVPEWKLFASLFAYVLIGGACLIGAVLWFVFLTARPIKPSGLPYQPVTKLEADRLAWKGAFILSGYLVFSIITELISGLRTSPLGGVVPPLLIIALLGILNRTSIAGKVITLHEQGVSWTGSGKLVLWGFIGFCAEMPLSLGMSVLGSTLLKNLPAPSHPATTLLQNNPNLAVMLSVTFLASVMAPFWEEILFRGTLFPALSRYVGIVPSALLTSFLFAAIHPQGIVLWLGLGTIAAVSCALVYYTKSLVPSIIMHALHNSAILFLAITSF